MYHACCIESCYSSAVTLYMVYHFLPKAFIPATVLCSLQELGSMITGECKDFQVVPGHGLKCVVSGVETYASQRQTDVLGLPKVASRCVCVDSETSFFTNEEASQTRKYDVSTIRILM